MAKIAPIAWVEFIKGLRKFDFDGPFRGGKHPYMVKDDCFNYSEPTQKEKLALICLLGF